MTKWVGVALVAVSVCVLIGVTLLALSVYAVVTHVDIEGTNERRAAERFQEIRGRFSGQTPMLTVDGAGSYTPQVSARTDTEPIPKTLAFMKWNPEEERLVSVHLPLWLLRWGTDANVSFDTEDGDLGHARTARRRSREAWSRIGGRPHVSRSTARARVAGMTAQTCHSSGCI